MMHDIKHVREVCVQSVRREESFEIQQFTKQIVHFRVPECSLDLHVLHHLQCYGLEGGQSEEKLRETLRGDRVDALGPCLQRLQNLLLVDLDLLTRGWTQPFGIWREKDEKTFQTCTWSMHSKQRYSQNEM